MKQHTQEPWSHAYRESAKSMFAEEVFDADGNVIATMAWHQVKNGNVTTTDREANARRIVACVNVCHGLREDELAVGIVPAPNFIRIREQRDELLAALKDALKKAQGDFEELKVTEHDFEDFCWVIRSRTAIQKAEAQS